MLSIILGILLLTLILIAILILLEVERSLIEKTIKIVALTTLNVATFIIINHVASVTLPFVLMATGYIYTVTLLISMNVKNYGAKLWTSTNVAKFIGITFAAATMLLALTLNMGIENQYLLIAKSSVMVFTVYHFISNAYKMTYEAASLISFNTKRSAKELYSNLMDRRSAFETEKEKKFNFFDIFKK